ncbi:MAG: hypothetical protein ACF8MJ_12305 [Phycisphaerales bacterium JB050]
MSQKTRHRGANRRVKSKSTQHAQTVLAIILLLVVGSHLAVALIGCLT